MTALIRPLPLVLVLSVLALAACSSAPARLHLGVGDDPVLSRLMWPPGPEVPRYQFAGQLFGEVNFVRDEASDGALTRFFRWLVGLADDRPKTLQRPQGVAVDSDGRILVSDVSRAAVFVFDGIAGELRILEYASGQRRFVAPIGIATDDDGSFWVADAELAVVAHLKPDGTTLPPIGVGELERPTDLHGTRSAAGCTSPTPTATWCGNMPATARHCAHLAGGGTTTKASTTRPISRSAATSSTSPTR